MDGIRKTIQDAIVAYLNARNPRYLFLIGGEGGLGKTYFVTTELQQVILDAHQELHQSKSKGLLSVFLRPLLALHKHLTREEMLPRYFSLADMISVNMLKSALSLPRDVEPTNAAKLLYWCDLFESNIYVRLSLATVSVAMIPYSFFYEPRLFMPALILFVFYALFLYRHAALELLSKLPCAQKIVETLRLRDYVIIDDVDKARFPLPQLADYIKQLILERKATILLITDHLEQTTEQLSQKMNVKYLTPGEKAAPSWKDDASGVILYVYRFTNDQASIAMALDHFLESLPNAFRMKKEQRERLLQHCQESHNTNLTSIFALAKKATDVLDKLYRENLSGVMNADDIALKILNKVLNAHETTVEEALEAGDICITKDNAMVATALDHYSIEVDSPTTLFSIGSNDEIKSDAKVLEALATLRLASQHTPYQVKEAYETLVKGIRAKKVAPNLLLEIFLRSMKLRIQRVNVDTAKMQRAMEHYVETSDAIPFFDNSNYDLSIFDVEGPSGEKVNCAAQLKKVIEFTERNILRRIKSEFMDCLRGNDWGESFNFFVFNNGFHFVHIQQLFSLIDPEIIVQKIRQSRDEENAVFFKSVLNLYHSPIVDVYFKKDRVALITLVNALDNYLLELRSQPDFSDATRNRILILKTFVDEMERVIRKIPLPDSSA